MKIPNVIEWRLFLYGLLAKRRLTRYKTVIMRRLDLAGERVGLLLVIRAASMRSPRGYRLWQTICQRCGRLRLVPTNNLTRNCDANCACARKSTVRVKSDCTCKLLKRGSKIIEVPDAQCPMHPCRCESKMLDGKQWRIISVDCKTHCAVTRINLHAARRPDQAI